MGGKIESIVWDPTGTRVAIMYRSSTPSVIPVSSNNGGDLTGPLVVIFSVAWEPFLIFTRR